VTALGEKTAKRAIADLPAPPGLPVAGNALQLKSDRLHLVLEDWARKLGPVFRFNIGRRPIVAFASEEPINALLRERPDTFRRWNELAMALNEIGINGVFTAEGDDWRRQRKLAVMALNSNHVHRYYEVIRVCTERLAGRLDRAVVSERPFDLRRLFMAFTTDVTASLAFGHDLNSLERESELQHHLECVLPFANRRIMAPVPYWRYVKPPADRTAERSLRYVRSQVEGFIGAARERMAERPELFEKPENFLEGMLAAQRDGRYSDDEVFGNTFTMLLAGEDTTAFSLSWAAWYLANDPELQARVADEARTVLGEARVPPDAAAADALAFSDALLREAMRLKSAAPLLFFEALEDTSVAGIDMPRGSRLVCLSRYADAAARPSFDPDREDKRALNFGAGPRFCPGRNLALLEARAAIATLAHGFEISLDPGAAPVEERFGFTMAPSALQVMVRYRR
jgi:cytochrome P450